MSMLITNDGNDEKRITRFGQRDRKKIDISCVEINGSLIFKMQY